jgi:hypothetical protein
MAFDLMRVLRAFIITEAAIQATKDRPLMSIAAILLLKDHL